MRHLRLLSLLALSGCAGSKSAPAPAAPPRARLQADTTTYFVIEHRQVEQRFQGQPIVTNSTTTLRLIVSLAADTGGFGLTATIDSVTVSGDAGFPADLAKAARGVKLTGHVAPDGMVREIAAPDQGNALLDQIALSLQDFLPRLPPAGVPADSMWSDSITSGGRSAGVPLTILGSTTHHTGVWREWQDARILELVDTTRYSLNGEGSRAGQWLTLSGGGRSYAQRLITTAGVITFAAGSDTLDLQLDVGGTGTVIPMTQTRTDTVFREVR
jgi:hypothetical protein